MSTVSALSIAAMAVSLAVCVGLPVGLCIFMKKAGKASLKSFFLGCGTFVVSALVLEQILHLIVRAVSGTFFSEHLIAYAVYGGLAAGLFEETGRYVAMKFFMKGRLAKQEAIMYGVGHGGIEAILIGGMSCFSNLLTSVMINAGILEKLLPAGDAGIQAAISQLTGLPAWQFLLAGMERCSAVVLHIVLSYLVYLGVKNKKIQFFIFAVLVHFLVDAGVVLAANYVPVLALELGLLAVVLGMEAFVYTGYSREGAENDSVNDSLGQDGNLDGFLFTASAKPELGFHFGYFMYVPSVLRETPVLIVEGPSVGEVGPMDKACEIVYEKAVFELTAGGFPHRLAKVLQCPIIMPLFPRPEDKENNTNIFTHALTSRAMSVIDSPIERIDLQLIAMFQDIKDRFLRAGIKLHDKVIVKGFSSGGEFAHRFTLLHPQYVLAAVGGGNMHSFTLPLKTYQGETLIWPNGMGNTDSYCSFDYDCYKAVKQLFYMGDMDYNDAVPYNDSYTEEERQQVYRLFGKVGMPDRWNKYQELVKTLGLDNIECKTNPGLDHRPGNEIRDYITVFLRDILAGT